MNRYKKTFKNLNQRKEKALIPFTVIGDPDYKTSISIMKAMIDHGADVLELGATFSDPIADGATIQAADVRAQKAGMDTNKFFKAIKEIRNYNHDIPIGILMYANLIYQRGINKFYKDAKQAGIDSVLVADLPIEEAAVYVKAARANKIDAIFFATPLSTKQRIKQTAKKGSGFIYVVSRLGITGARKELPNGSLALLRRLKKYTKIPLCVGFGISNPQQVQQVCEAGADGVIVGSTVVMIIENNKNRKTQIPKKVGTFISSLKQATY
jgi:tryptophan synthase alpha chain